MENKKQELTNTDSNSATVAGYTASPIFDDAIIKKATQITFGERLLLLFRRKKYSRTVEDFLVTRITYKKIRNKIYILKIERYQEPPGGFNCRCFYNAREV